MTRNDFLNMIKETSSVNRKMTGEIYELIDIFPYFQSAHLLLLKGLKNNSDVKFDNQLRQSSLHVADREVLYYLLQSKASSDDNSPNDNGLVKSSEDNQANSRQTVIESAMNSDLLINEIEANDESRLPGAERIDERNEGHPILISTEGDDEDNSGVMFLIEEEDSTTEESLFYMDPGFSVPENTDLLELDIEDKEDKEDKGGANKIDTSERSLQSELIDRFITENPRIEPNRDKNAGYQEDLSEPFEGTGAFVTETLAMIYFNQGYYSRAIDIYEKLSLKFPEKSSYFASQIEKVKDYIKN